MTTESLDHARFVPLPEPAIPPLVLWVMRIAAALAVVLSGYLAWLSLSNTAALGCGGFDCDEILGSGWAKWFGMPVAIPAMSLYLGLLVALAFAGSQVPDQVRRLAWTIALALSFLAGAAALWFLGLQLFVIGQFCSWCLTVHICGLGLAVLALAAGQRCARKLWGAGIAALGAVGLLALGQLVGPPDSPKLQRVASGTPAATDTDDPQRAGPQKLTVDDLYGSASYPPSAHDSPNGGNLDNPSTTLPTSTSPSLDDLTQLPSEDLPADSSNHGASADTQPQRRIVSLYRGKAEVDVYQHPVLGSPDAPLVVVKLFDYTCPNCRLLHEHLAQAQREFGSDLAVVMCPAPLNRQCNPHVQIDNAKHAEACDLARLALAVWQAEPAKFAEFNAWLFAPAIHPSAENSRAKAVELVGESKLAEQLYSDSLRQRLAVGPKLYNLVGTGTVPKLLLPTGMLVGPGENAAAIVRELRQEFALE